MKPTICIHAKYHGINRLFARLSGRGITVKTYQPRTVEAVLSEPDAAHVVWASGQHIAMAQFAHNAAVWFAEDGWLGKHATFYVDPHGAGASSTLPHSMISLMKYDADGDARRVARLHKYKGVANADSATGGLRGYILVPLQLDRDANIRHYSGMAGHVKTFQPRMLDMVCDAFQDHTIVVRPHPNASVASRRIIERSLGCKHHGNVRVESSGNSYQWAANAAAVVGINSTVLIEALTFYKPVCAIGAGVFTGNGVMLEGADNIENLITHLPDEDNIGRFLAALFDRQISYRRHTAEPWHHPSIAQVVNMARGLA